MTIKELIDTLDIIREKCGDDCLVTIPKLNPDSCKLEDVGITTVTLTEENMVHLWTK